MAGGNRRSVELVGKVGCWSGEQEMRVPCEARPQLLQCLGEGAVFRLQIQAQKWR